MNFGVLFTVLYGILKKSGNFQPRSKFAMLQFLILDDMSSPGQTTAIRKPKMKAL